MEGYTVPSAVGFLACSVVLLFAGIIGFVVKIISEILKPEYDPDQTHKWGKLEGSESTHVSKTSLAFRVIGLLCFIFLIVAKDTKESVYLSLVSLTPLVTDKFQHYRQERLPYLGESFVKVYPSI